MPHLFIDISSHGFGHLAQAAPVINALTDRRPGLRMTIRCGLPAEKMRTRVRVPFQHIAGSSDFGFLMRDAVSIDRAATASAYRDWHADWEARVDTEATLLRSLSPDLVLTDVAYLPLAGASRAGIPALSMCSLNWADIFFHVFGHEDWAASLHAQMLSAYRSAEYFLRLTPAMPMNDLPNARAVAPIAALGNNRREELHHRLDLPAETRTALIAFGGFDKELNVGCWPETPGVHWLVPESWGTARTDMTPFEPLRMNFTDLLSSVDAVLTKPGYGTFTEAACNGTAILYIRRRDGWPEQGCLIEWLEKNARNREIGEAVLLQGNVEPELEKLWRQEPPVLPKPDGAAEVAALIDSLL